MQRFPRKFAEIQGIPGCVIFYTEYLIACGLKVDTAFLFTVLTVQQAQQLGLL